MLFNGIQATALEQKSKKEHHEEVQMKIKPGLVIEELISRYDNMRNVEK